MLSCLNGNKSGPSPGQPGMKKLLPVSGHGLAAWYPIMLLPGKCGMKCGIEW